MAGKGGQKRGRGQEAGISRHRQAEACSLGKGAKGKKGPTRHGLDAGILMLRSNCFEFPI